MATYKEIEREARACSGGRIRTVKSCWIADAKERCGLPVRRAPNRVGSDRRVPCPQSVFPYIRRALKRLGAIE